MANELLKSRHAFGALENVDNAISAGTIDSYDILFLKSADGTPCIGWLDKEGNKVILEDKKQVVSIDAFPETGDPETVYIYDSKFYFWNGTEFVTTTTTGMDEAAVDNKVHEALEAANAYTDEQIANAVSTEVVEF